MREEGIRASYDANGDIILRKGDPAPEPPARFDPSPSPQAIRIESDTRSWIAPAWLEQDEPRLIMDANLSSREEIHDESVEGAYTLPLPDVASLVGSIRSITRDALSEGLNQVVVSVVGSGPVLRDASGSAAGLFARAFSLLGQPVWVPTRKKTLKQYSRGTLFALDVVRFGATFTGIFVVLFFALNYQSFWQIVSSQVDRYLGSASLDGPSDSLTPAARDLVVALAADARKDGDLLSYLPTVGPPENRIVIPKLGLNVPLVNPSYEALLRQDWTQVETDIQDALQTGVVHYPGTARPGQAGNFFVTGHSSYYPWAPGNFKTVFARLHELSVGDEYWVYFGGDKHRYVVRSKQEVLPTDVSVLDQPGDSRISTLMTCTPIGTTLRRLIVRAEEVDPVSGQALRVGQRTDEGLKPRPQLEALPI